MGEKKLTRIQINFVVYDSFKSKLSDSGFDVL
jgi:hypothetical protein